MSRHVITLTIDIDDEELAEHAAKSEERGGPYTRRVAEWDASDVFRCADLEIIDPGDCEFAYEFEVKDTTT